MILWFVCALLFVALVFSIMLQKWGLTLWGDTVDYTRFGTWGQMASAIGTTIAFGIAFANLISARLIFSAGEHRRKEEEETSIFFWFSCIEEKNKDGTHHGWQWDLNIQNSTKFPIYTWAINFEIDSSHMCNFQKKPLIPGSNIFNLPSYDNVEPSKSPNPKLFFESKSTGIWSRTAKGVLEKEDLMKALCSHNLLNNS